MKRTLSALLLSAVLVFTGCSASQGNSSNTVDGGSQISSNNTSQNTSSVNSGNSSESSAVDSSSTINSENSTASGSSGDDSTVSESEASAPNENSNSSESAPTESSVNSDPESEPPAEPETGKILIAYFSWSGNTRQLAGMIQNETSGDLFEITPAGSYTDDYNALLDQAQQEQRDNARPALANSVENFEGYDVIFVGYPNWWSDTPMAILTFLESYDFSGKTVVPFCTHGSGGFGRSISSIKNSAAGATVLDGFEVRGTNVGNAQDSVSSWISGLNLE